MLKLNLGGYGENKPGYTCVDLRGDNPINVLEGLPYKDNSVDEIYSRYFLEHIPQDKVVWLMNEMWRVLKVGGIMEHRMPLANTEHDIADPTHLSKWNLKTFEYFEKGNKKNDYYSYIKPWEVIVLGLEEPSNDSIIVVLKK